MSMTPLRKHMALAIDGGVSGGLVVAQALIAPKDEMGQKVFPPLEPAWFPKPLEQADELMRGMPWTFPEDLLKRTTVIGNCGTRFMGLLPHHRLCSPNTDNLFSPILTTTRA
jgi:hypothetical protein